MSAGRGEDAEDDVAGLTYPGGLVDFLAIRSSDFLRALVA